MAIFKRILVATDLGREASRAIDLAVALARNDDAELFVVHVFEVPAYLYTGTAFSPVDCLGPLQEEAQRRFDESVAAVRARYPRTQGIFRAGNAPEQILASIAEAGADLAVVGTHGRRGLARALLGSVAEKIVQLSPVPVLTAREPDDASRPRAG